MSMEPLLQVANLLAFHDACHATAGWAENAAHQHPDRHGVLERRRADADVVGAGLLWARARAHRRASNQVPETFLRASTPSKRIRWKPR